MNLTREELKAEAKKLGLKVRENFMDDWKENLIVLAFGVLLGFIAAKGHFCGG